jgi:tetratricopeptide (TPR) repeat protein
VKFVAALLLCAAGGLAGQSAPETIADRLNQAPLPAEQKAQVRKALETRDYHGAETILVRAIDANPKSADLLVLAARVFFVDNNPASAAIALKKAEKIRPLNQDERLTLSMAYIGIGKGAWARPELDRLAAADPQNTLYPYWLARIDFDEHMYDAAIERLQVVTKSNPGFVRGWDNLGLSLEGVGKLEQAVATYKEAVRLNRDQSPHSPWPQLNLGSLLTKMGDLKPAEEVLREAVGYDPKLGEAHYRLGANLHKQGREDDAVTELRRAADLDPSATEPLYVLGQIYRSQGNAAAADQVFERFKELKKKRRGSAGVSEPRP